MFQTTNQVICHYVHQLSYLMGVPPPHRVHINCQAAMGLPARASARLFTTSSPIPAPPPQVEFSDNQGQPFELYKLAYKPPITI